MGGRHAFLVSCATVRGEGPAQREWIILEGAHMEMGLVGENSYSIFVYIKGSPDDFLQNRALSLWPEGRPGKEAWL